MVSHRIPSSKETNFFLNFLNSDIKLLSLFGVVDMCCSGMHRSPSTTAHSHMPVMCGVTASHCGKCSPMENHHMGK